MKRVGIVGYGKLGKYLTRKLLEDDNVRKSHELCFVWNRNSAAIDDSIPKEKILKELSNFTEYNADLIVEVAHPQITKHFGAKFIQQADYMVGSPTVFADAPFERKFRDAIEAEANHGVYLPRGAMPAIEEVIRLEKSGLVAAASITMKKHPDSLKYSGDLDTPLDQLLDETILYRGPLRQLCRNAPNNVNTMAVFALASKIGFDDVEAILVADPSLDYHVIEIEIFGPSNAGKRFQLDIQRVSPAGAGAITSEATLSSFLDSMLLSHGAGPGLHFR